MIGLGIAPRCTGELPPLAEVGGGEVVDAVGERPSTGEF